LYKLQVIRNFELWNVCSIEEVQDASNGAGRGEVKVEQLRGAANLQCRRCWDPRATVAGSVHGSKRVQGWW